MVSVLPPGSFKILALTLWSCGFTRVCLCADFFLFILLRTHLLCLCYFQKAALASLSVACAHPRSSRLQAGPLLSGPPDSLSLLNLACLLCVCSRDNVFKYTYLSSNTPCLSLVSKRC